LAGWWRDYNPALRAAAITLWLFGIAFAMLGALGDSRGWWAGRPFATNLVSSLVGACFGIPIALIVIQRLAANQLEMVERRSAMRHALRTMQDFIDTASRLVKHDPRTHHIQEPLIRNIREVHHGLQSAASKDEIGFAELKELERTAQKAEVEIGTWIPHYGEYQSLVHSCNSTWTLMSTDVRSRLSENGLPWLDERRVHHLESMLKDLTNVPMFWRAVLSDLVLGLWKLPRGIASKWPIRRALLI